MDEIPIAQRDLPPASPPPPWGRIVVGIFLGVGAIAAVVGLWLAQISGETVVEAEREPEPEPAPTVENVLGHLPYADAGESDLVNVTADGSVRLRSAAAARYQEMAAAARREGVLLAALSGYRTKAQQDYLFFQIKEQRNQRPSERAEVSAPPGFSEHHTGYAIDIGDANVPATHLSPQFENTAAFTWLQANAARYGFELSFPRDNPQGIAYEPWHWRFVGDMESLETFYRAQNLPPISP
ncbi:MAG: D-alanyl-D-alanine carboxypeptidase family protein [Spirulina sp. DLM2.Bin59]|nr:MAG: D-alanyl-D-alanine carboxypeptidase family protein [Spirulina sp. DLM2.Bin59]